VCRWVDKAGIWTWYLTTATTPLRISFYHGKHGNLSLGARPFHISVSQAIKNLQRMTLPADEIDRKIVGWKALYVSGSGVDTSIPRIARGDPTELGNAFARSPLQVKALRSRITN
jgi:hypothetical protein